jgi:DNA-binding CsgD family transcriptional regulator
MRGAPDAAAELAQEAVRLTPAGALELDRRTLNVAEYHMAAGRTLDAIEWIDKLLRTELAGPLRARALMLRYVLEHDVDAGGRILGEAFEHVGDDPALRALLLMMLSAYHTYLEPLDLGASERAAREALDAAERAGEPVLLAAALSIVADRADLAGRPEDALFERALPLEDAHSALLGRSARERLAKMLVRRAHLSDARQQFETVIENALRAGAAMERCRAWVGLFEVEWRAGAWHRAERLLEDAWSGAVEDAGDLWAEAELTESRARLSALRGEVDEARHLVAAGIAHAEAMHWAYLVERSRWVLGFLELSLGDPAGAWESLASASGIPPRGSLEVLEAVADGVEALVGLGRLDDAEGLLETLRHEAARGHRWAAPAVDRCAALLLVARGDLDAAATAADRAADGFDAIEFPLDRARALYVGGEALRRSGMRRLAAEKLEAAREIFARLGASLWVDRAETELRRARPRPRRDSELTSAERRVAALVASGKANREVAAQLFTTVATVEAHLTRIYRKLGLRSRTELARRVADGSLSLADD